MRQLKDLVRRIKESEEAEAVFLTGSVAQGKQTKSSDVDVVILTRRPVTEFLVSTYLDGRLADVIIADSACLKRAAGAKPAAMDSFASWMSGWLRKATILHDPRGLVGKAKARLGRRPHKTSKPGFNLLYPEWFALNNNLRHNTLLVEAKDPVYRMALRIRLLYSTMDALLAYFRLRGLAWPGEKEAVRYLIRHDRRTLHALETALGHGPLRSSFTSYDRLVTAATTRRWPRWKSRTTAVQLLTSGQATRTKLERCRSMWRRLTED